MITRDPSTHQITLIQSHALNVASLEAAGVDLDLAYKADILGGDFSANLIATHLIKRRNFSFQDDPSDYEELAGTLGYADWQANLTLNYKYENWLSYWRTRFVNDVSLYTDKDLALNANPSSNMQYDDYFISDVALGYQFDSGITLKFGIDNLFDKDLPYGSTGTSAGSAAYDNIGRFYYTSLNYSF